MKTDAVIIGGGLAGLTAALHLRKLGIGVVLIEKEAYPHHKVCGEYLSAEVLPYLYGLGVDVHQLNPAVINRLLFTTTAGKEVHARLPLGGLGISRFSLDTLLYNKAKVAGCGIIHDTASEVTFEDSNFSIQLLSGSRLSAGIVISAHGKRSSLDQKMKRRFIQRKSPWLAVKAHYQGDFPDDLVALHHFQGGYCGVSKVEDGKINICYLADYTSFKKYKNIDTYQQTVLYQNRHLRSVFENSSMLFDEPLAISQIAFGKKEIVENHVLMVGDSAGLIHPLSGNGMAMAIHGAKICAELVADYVESGTNNRSKLESAYREKWQQTFGSRLGVSKILSDLLQHKGLTTFSIAGISHLPFVLPMIIRKTHGNPITNSFSC